MKKQKIIIDTDPGIDDAMAIMLAVKSNSFDILAVTTVCGNSSIENTTKNARFILNSLGRTDIPIYSGSKKPMRKVLYRARVHGTTGLDGIVVSNKPELNNKAVKKIAEIAQRYPNEITLICLGPLTNVAKAMKKFPDAMKLLTEIYIMGGAIQVPGNMSCVAEFNIFTDPEAAEIVFSFPIKKILVPLDLCNTVTMNLQDFEKIEQSPLRDILLSMINPYMDNLYRIDGIRDAMMYDPLTIYACLFPKRVKTKQYNIVIETKGTFTQGMTIADLRNKKEMKPNIIAVTQIEIDMFKKDFVRILSKK